MDTLTPEQQIALRLLLQGQEAALRQEFAAQQATANRQVAEAQAAAIQAQASSFPPSRGSGTAAAERPPDARLGRPQVFMGGTKGKAQWPDFAFKLNANAALDDPAASTEMTRLDDSSCKSKKIADMTPAMQSAARRLFFALTMLTSHGAMEIVRQGIDEKNGFEAYAALVARLSPNEKS